MAWWDAVITFVSDEANREIVSWLGGGLVVVSAGLWAVFKYVHRSPQAPEPSVRVTAAHGSIAGGGDVTVGVLPEQLPGIIDAATQDQRAKIEELEEKLGVGERAVRAFFRVLDEAAVPLEQRQARLVAIAEDYKRALANAEPAEGDTPQVAELKAKARDALEAGDFDDADAFLAQVQAAEDAEIDRRRLQAAITCAQRGDLAMTRLRYRDAARQFADAAARVPADQPAKALLCLVAEAEALYRQGDEFGDNDALAGAISRCRQLLDRRPRDVVPLDWATTQTKLGSALLRLGEREGDATYLTQAVEAFRASLVEGTRDREPLQWATTQNNLAVALKTLGEREGNRARLEEAIEACRAALCERTRERVPLDWAMTQDNLGSTLGALGRLESGTAHLEGAVEATALHYSRGPVSAHPSTGL